MSTSNIVGEYTCTWKYTPPEAQEYFQVQRGEIKVNATSVADAFREAKKSLCGARPDWDAERVEIVTVQEPFL